MLVDPFVSSELRLSELLSEYPESFSLSLFTLDFTPGLLPASLSSCFSSSGFGGPVSVGGDFMAVFLREQVKAETSIQTLKPRVVSCNNRLRVMSSEEVLFLRCPLPFAFYQSS